MLFSQPGSGIGESRLLRAVFLEPQKTHQCPTCLKRYRHYSSLYNHTKFECGKEKSFACTFCNFKSFRKENLKSHVRVKHLAQAFHWSLMDKE
ncbi:hypothetical protein HUJ04_008536 [Dendroctonus ponderosae]|nr:hypothetical protein HUJ04_008536 [Dendroctonus ponderosae]